MKNFFQLKLILLILVFLAVLNGTVALSARLILMDSFLNLEQQVVEENLLRVANAVRAEAEGLGTTCTDWAVWDDTYRFVQDRNQAYAISNLGDATLADLHLSALLYFDSHGQLVFGKAMDLTEQAVVAVPTELVDYLTNNENLWPSRKNLGHKDGFLLLQDGPMLVSLRPILTSQGEGPAQGLLVMARWVDDQFVDQLAGRTALPVTATRLAGEWPGQNQDILLQVSDRKATTISGEVFFRDLDGRPAVQLAVTMDRGLYLQGKKTVDYFQLGFALISCSFGLFFYVLIIVARRKRAVVEGRFRQIFEHASDGLLVVDNRDNEILMNPTAQRLLEEDQPLVDSKQFRSKHSEVGQLMKDGLDGKSIGPTVLQVADTDSRSKKPLRAYMVPLLAEDGKQHGAIATLQDMTQETRREQKKTKAMVAAVQKLKNPLSILLGDSDLLLKQAYSNEAEKDEICKRIIEKASTLEQIVDGLLNIGKTEIGRKVCLQTALYDICSSIRQVADVIQKQTQRHKVFIDLPEESIEVNADRERVGQVLDILLRNAAKNSPAGGAVTVSLRRNGANLEFCVTDQSVVPSEEQTALITEKLSRAVSSSTEVRGMAPDLNVSKDIIEAHGGRIWTESIPGEGTKTWFTLPCESSR